MYVWVCMDLDGSTCSECLPERTCHFQPPEHVPRTSTGAQTCVWGPCGIPVCHGAESTTKDPRPEEKKMSNSEENNFLYGVYTRIPFWEWDASLGVKQAGMPQGKMINRHPVVLVA